MKLVITGSPAAGRSSLCLRLADFCMQNGLKTGGMVSKEVPSGLEVCDFESGAAGVFLKKESAASLRGDYSADLFVLESVGVPAIENAVACCDVVLIDWIGEMQVRSKGFRQACYSAFGSWLHVIAAADERFAGTFARTADFSVDVSKEGVQKCYERALSRFGAQTKKEI